MNKNLFTSPSKYDLVFPIVMIIFALITLFFNIILALAEIGLTVAYFIAQFFMRKQRDEQLYSHLQSITLYLDEASRESLTRFPMPVTLLGAKGEIVWYNDLFHELLVSNKLSEVFGKNFDVIVPHLSIGGKDSPKSQKHEVSFLGRQYTIYIMRQGDSGKNDFYSVYWIDETEIKNDLQLMRSQRLCVAYILLDSYDELPSGITELQKSTFVTRVDVKIRALTKAVGGVLKKLETDKYMVLFEQKYLSSLEKSKFKILADVKEISVEGFHATLSIGIGRDAKNLDRTDYAARSALDMALSRGGDQAVLSNGERYVFYGGNSDGAERRKRVKVRIIAEAFASQIQTVDNVIIMGHKFADLDCVGAAIGIAKCVTALGKKPYIIYNPKENLSASMYEVFLGKPGYEEWFVDSALAQKVITDNSFLVVVDTHNLEYIESEKIYRQFKSVMVIDHHRKALHGAIDNAMITFHEPNASSSCEMVSELCENIKNCKLNKDESNALLAGIFLDTKTFTERTGIRTFEAAAALKRQGADTAEVRRFFKSDFESYKKQIDIISDATVIKGNVAISVWRGKAFEGIKVTASKAADDMLNLTNITYSYVIYPENGEVHISARSDQNENVQRVMEQMGGGGHRNSAGAQIRDMDMDEVYEKLVTIISETQQD